MDSLQDMDMMDMNVLDEADIDNNGPGNEDEEDMKDENGNDEELDDALLAPVDDEVGQEVFPQHLYFACNEMVTDLFLQHFDVESQC